MKRNNKKGFTIVELVIVIAVIAILAGVMIPTFGNIIDKANNSNRDQQAKNAYTNYLVEHDFTTKSTDAINGYISVEYKGATYYYTVTAGQINITNETTTVPSSGTHLNAPATPSNP